MADLLLDLLDASLEGDDLLVDARLLSFQRGQLLLEPDVLALLKVGLGGVEESSVEAGILLTLLKIGRIFRGPSEFCDVLQQILSSTRPSASVSCPP